MCAVLIWRNAFEQIKEALQRCESNPHFAFHRQHGTGSSGLVLRFLLQHTCLPR